MNATKHTYRVGQRVVMQADPVLGSDEEPVTIVSLEDYGYEVKDSMGWTGPMSFDCEPLQRCP